jgi:hypothetical protein
VPESPSPPPRLGPPFRGVTSRDVELAADALLRAGERPTIERVREKIGRGSPNTINPALDAWWKRLASRLDAGPAALHRLPETVAHVAEALWMQALDEARQRAEQELTREARAALSTKQDLEVRSHVLTLREGELESRLRDRERRQAALQAQVQDLTLLLRKEQATREAQARRIASLEDQLLASSSLRWAVRAPALARQRRVRRASPTRLPESRPRPLDSVAVSLPQGSRRQRAPKPPARHKATPNKKVGKRPALAAQPPRPRELKRKTPTRKRRR